MPGSPRTNTVPPPHMAVGTLSHRLRISAVAFALGIAALGTAWEAHAQVPDDKGRGNETLRAGVRDSDRLFIRTTAGYLIRERQLGALMRKQASTPPMRGLGTKLSEQSNGLYRGLSDIAKREKTEIPLDMVDESHAKLQRLATLRGAAFDQGAREMVLESLAQEIKAFESAADKTDNGIVRNWIAKALGQRRALLDEFRRAAPR
ncbi:Uncharacterised protein [Xylophilus ampelinus]|nr:Uncharacterised protein [Xylophilus ampelinus]